MKWKEQYLSAKARHPDMLLLFQMGNFWEFFDDDAELASKLLGLTLTKRGDVLMACFPRHVLETSLRKLLQAKYRVAICEPVKEESSGRS